MPRKIEYLQELLKCDFSKVQSKIESRDTAVSGGFTFRYKSARFCKNEFCEGHDYSNDAKRCMQSCPEVEINDVATVCQQKTSIMKIIRICNLEKFAGLMNVNKNLKVLSVLRDPRAVGFSRMKWFKNWNLQNVITNMKWTCLDWQKSLEQAFFVDPSWMKNRFMVLRVEDYFGAEGGGVTFWTKISSQFLGVDENFEDNFFKFYEGEIRDRKENYDDWRWSDDINFEMVAGVQEVCGKFMELAGYKNVNSIEELKNKDVRLW